MYTYPHMCVCESMCPCMSPCYLQCLHAVYLCVISASLCTSMLSLYDSMSLTVSCGVYVYILSLCVSVACLCITCVFPRCLCVVCMRVLCVSMLFVCTSLCASVLSCFCAIFLLSLVSPCELVLPWCACLYVTCVSPCLCVQHTCLCGLSSVVCCLVYFLWPPR